MIMEMNTFRKFLLDHEDFVSSIALLCHFVMILTNHNEKSRTVIFCGKIFTSLS